MNRLVNKYGAQTSHKASEAIQEFQVRMSDEIGAIIIKNGLEPEEMIAFEHQLIQTVTTSIAEGILGKALAMKKAERKAEEAYIHTISHPPERLS